jgi:hypothetical protein
LSEKGKIAYTPDVPLDESCYREVTNCDMFVLIVGGRYGSEASSSKSDTTKSFHDRYNSVTRLEFRAAVDRDIPAYVLIERSVYAEYETYLRNKTRKDVTYAHVDSVNIFQLIEEILLLPRNNPVFQFDRYEEIEAWLREQWAGLFRELLQRIQSHAQIASLQVQVEQLAELNKTLKAYLEEVVTRLAPGNESAILINAETRRLDEATLASRLKAHSLGGALIDTYEIAPQRLRELIAASADASEFLHALTAEKPSFQAIFEGWRERYLDELQEEFRELGRIAGVFAGGETAKARAPRRRARPRSK